MRRFSLRLIFALASFVFWGAGMSWAAPGDLIGTLPDPTGIYDGFGVSIVPMDENRFWVGAHGLTDPDYPGAIFLFNTEADSHLIIDNPTGFIGENFGEFMVLANDLLVVSAKWAYVKCKDTWHYGVGVVYVYKADTGDFVQKIEPPEVVTEDSVAFGGALAFNPETNEVFIAYHGAEQPIGSGAIYIYDVSSSGLTQKGKLNPPVLLNCTFAGPISLGNGKLLGTLDPCDRAQLIDLSTGELIQTLESPDTSPREFGAAVAYANSVWAVSDPLKGPYGSGSVFLYEGEAGDYLRTVTLPTPYSNAQLGRKIVPYVDKFLIKARYDVHVFNTSGEHVLTIPTGPYLTNGISVTKSKILVGGSGPVRIFEGLFTPDPSPTPTPENSPVPTISLTPSPSLTVSPSATPTPTPDPDSPPSPSITPTLSPCNSPSPSPTPTRTPSPIPSVSQTPSATDTPTPTPSPSLTATPTQSQTASPTETPTPSATPSASPSPIPDTAAIRAFLLGLAQSNTGLDVTSDGSVDVADLIAAFSR